MGGRARSSLAVNFRRGRVEIVEIVEEVAIFASVVVSVVCPPPLNFGQKAASLRRYHRRRLPRSRDKSHLLSPCRGPLPAPYNILFSRLSSSSTSRTHPKPKHFNN